jgi:hypothetical protein
LTLKSRPSNQIYSSATAITAYALIKYINYCLPVYVWFGQIKYSTNFANIKCIWIVHLWKSKAKYTNRLWAVPMHKCDFTFVWCSKSVCSGLLQQRRDVWFLSHSRALELLGTSFLHIPSSLLHWQMISTRIPSVQIAWLCVCARQTLFGPASIILFPPSTKMPPLCLIIKNYLICAKNENWTV